VRWVKLQAHIDKKMRVPLHRVWTAGVSSVGQKPGHRNCHK
jgi:hypothetical protein